MAICIDNEIYIGGGVCEFANQINNVKNRKA